MVVRPDLKNEPYCGNCGYTLTGAVESSRCPECGRPLVEVLTRNAPAPVMGKRYRSKARIFGMPVVDVALGPANGEIRGVARGFVAIGDIAIGFLSIGAISFGVVAIGGLGIGFFALGGMAIGLLTAFGGSAFGTLAVGGAAVGILATGGGAIGVFAQGGGAVGTYVRDARTLRRSGGGDPLEAVSWFFGSGPPGPASILLPVSIVLGLTLAAAAVIGLIAWLAILRTPDGADAARGTAS